MGSEWQIPITAIPRLERFNTDSRPGLGIAELSNKALEPSDAFLAISDVLATAPANKERVITVLRGVPEDRRNQILEYTDNDLIFADQKKIKDGLRNEFGLRRISDKDIPKYLTEQNGPGASSSTVDRPLPSANPDTPSTSLTPGWYPRIPLKADYVPQEIWEPVAQYLFRDAIDIPTCEKAECHQNGNGYTFTFRFKDQPSRSVSISMKESSIGPAYQLVMYRSPMDTDSFPGGVNIAHPAYKLADSLWSAAQILTSKK